jgi:polyhydroxyalkanoate synthesis repressor PhaR
LEVGVSASVAILKKYKNRRIYDGRTSSYVTIDDVRAMFLAGEPIRIIDGSNENDLTNQVLLQLLASEVTSSKALPQELLQKALVAANQSNGSSFTDTVVRALRGEGILEPSVEAESANELRRQLRRTFAIPPSAAAAVDPLAGSVAKMEMLG